MKIIVAFRREWTKPFERRRELLQCVGLRRIRGDHLLLLLDFRVARLQKLLTIVYVPELLVSLAAEVTVIKRHLPRRNAGLTREVAHQKIAAVMVRVSALVSRSKHRAGRGPANDVFERARSAFQVAEEFLIRDRLSAAVQKSELVGVNVGQRVAGLEFAHRSVVLPALILRPELSVERSAICGEGYTDFKHPLHQASAADGLVVRVGDDDEGVFQQRSQSSHYLSRMAVFRDGFARIRFFAVPSVLSP